MIQRLKHKQPLVALKITSIEAAGGVCPRGGDGCGACALASDYLLAEETNAAGAKDTAQLLAAGASKVFWLRSLRTALAGGFAAFQQQIGEDPLVICESNYLRNLVKPAIFVMLDNNAAAKPSAKQVAALADVVLPYPWNKESEETILQKIEMSIKK